MLGFKLLDMRACGLVASGFGIAAWGMVGRVLCFCVDVDVDAVSFHAPGQNAIISNEIILSDPTQRSRSL